MTVQVENNTDAPNGQILVDTVGRLAQESLDSFSFELGEGRLAIAVNMQGAELRGRSMHAFAVVGLAATNTLLSDIVLAVAGALRQGNEAVANDTALNPEQGDLP